MSSKCWKWTLRYLHSHPFVLLTSIIFFGLIFHLEGFPHLQARAWYAARQTRTKSSSDSISFHLMWTENRLNIWSTILCVCPTGKKHILTFLKTPSSTSKCPIPKTNLFLFSRQQLSRCKYNFSGSGRFFAISHKVLNRMVITTSLPDGKRSCQVYARNG